MIRRQKMTIFTDAKETTPLMDVKRIIEGIAKIPPDGQRLFRDDQVGLITKVSMVGTTDGSDTLCNRI